MAMALDGIRVVDVSQVAAVPMAARHLADFGADVIHVENPTTGDSFRSFLADQRSWGTGRAAPSDYDYNWEEYNRNKRSISLDIRQKAGREVLYKIVERSDVFVTNLRPFELVRFRL